MPGVLGCCAIQSAEARFGQYLKNIGIVYGPVFRSPTATGQAWELSYDRSARSCIHRSRFWGVGLGAERLGQGNSWLYSARVSMSPYRILISRRISALTLVSMRVGRWSSEGGVSDLVRPEIGLQFMSYNTVLSPKLAVYYGRDIPIGRSTAENGYVLPSSALTVQVGITVNIGSLAAKWRRSKAERTSAG
ncbi:MAG: hypothetical protein ABI432_15265 [Flavobacteriales bacterium]